MPRVTKKIEQKHEKRLDEITLTVPDQFYIEHNPDLSLEELSSKLGKPLDIITEYASTLIKKDKGKRVRKNFDGDAKKGFTAMTEAASMDVDEAHKKYVTEEAVTRALADGNMGLAKELKARLTEQNKVNKELIRNKYKDMVHHILPIDDEDLI